MDNVIKNHLENFTLKDFIKTDDLSIEDRLKKFHGFMSFLTENNLSLYRRIFKGPNSPQTTIFDPVTSENKKFLMFGSNNYLNLTNHPDVIEAAHQSLKKYGAGAGGPPLLNGTTELHLQLEQDLAKFKKTEAAIIFSSGFMAQLGWMSALISREDLVFFDEYSHASFFDGLKLTNCQKMPFRHNNVSDLENKLQKYSAKSRNRWICIEGVYSMDGDLAPLDEIVELAKKYECKIALDDAHGTGVMGSTGTGSVEHFSIAPNDIFVHFGTFSKVFGSIGGFVCGSHKLIEYLRYMSRTHMFSAALPAPVIASVLAGLRVIQAHPELPLKLRENTQHFISSLKKVGISAQSDSAIVALLIPSGLPLRKMALDFHNEGIFINSVEYPAVPLDQQRFRISLMSAHTTEEIDQLVTHIKNIFSKYHFFGCAD